jgi:shikimate kinase
LSRNRAARHEGNGTSLGKQLRRIEIALGTTAAEFSAAFGAPESRVPDAANASNLVADLGQTIRRGKAASIPTMNPAPNLFLIGPMGAGKTSVGRRLAAQLGLRFVDLDVAFEERTGVSISLTFEIEGEVGFRKRESDLLEELVRLRSIVLSTGGGAVLDPGNRELLRDNGFVVWLDTDVDTQLNRLHADRQRPLLQGADRRERLLRMAELRNPLYAETADLRVNASGLGSSAAMARHVGAQIAKNWHYLETESTQT